MEAGSKVPFFSATGATFGVDLGACLQRIVDSGWYVLGPQVRDFEAAFANYVGLDQAIGVASGTDALALSLRGLDIGSGQRVLTVANAGCYASTAIAQVGADIGWVDVDDQTLSMAPGALAAALAAGPVAAVIVTHLYGRMADMPAITDLCQRANVPLVEDCAQAHGAVRDGRRAGAWGRVACFSFYPTKNLGALGDGGAIVTGDAVLADRLRALRQYGWTSKYEVTWPGGGNSRLDELQAAVLLAKLPRLEAANTERRAIAARYSQAFADLPLLCPPAPGPDNVVHLYVVRTPQRDALQAWLQARGVASDVHYPLADHRQGIHRDLGQTLLPVTDQACDQVLSLPCYPGLTAEQMDRVIAAVRGFFEQA